MAFFFFCIYLMFNGCRSYISSPIWNSLRLCVRPVWYGSFRSVPVFSYLFSFRFDFRRKGRCVLSRSPSGAQPQSSFSLVFFFFYRRMKCARPAPQSRLVWKNSFGFFCSKEEEEESKKRITHLNGNNRQLKHREVAAGALVGHFTARGIYGNRAEACVHMEKERAETSRTLCDGTTKKRRSPLFLFSGAAAATHVWWLERRPIGNSPSALVQFM